MNWKLKLLLSPQVHALEKQARAQALCARRSGGAGSALRVAIPSDSSRKENQSASSAPPGGGGWQHPTSHGLAPWQQQPSPPRLNSARSTLELQDATAPLTLNPVLKLESSTHTEGEAHGMLTRTAGGKVQPSVRCGPRVSLGSPARDAEGVRLAGAAPVVGQRGASTLHTAAYEHPTLVEQLGVLHDVYGR